MRTFRIVIYYTQAWRSVPAQSLSQMLLCITGISEADAQLLFMLQSPLDHKPACSPREAERASWPLGICRGKQLPLGCLGRAGDTQAVPGWGTAQGPWYCCCSLAWPHRAWWGAGMCLQHTLTVRALIQSQTRKSPSLLPIKLGGESSRKCIN